MLAFVLVSATNQPGEPADEGVYVPGYFETRLVQDENRTKVWKHLCAYLGRWIRPDAASSYAFHGTKLSGGPG